MPRIIYALLLPLLLSGCAKPEPEQMSSKSASAVEESVQPEEIIYLQVSPNKVECSGYEGQSECLQVKKVSLAADGKITVIDPDWALFYDSIQGYTHNPKQTVVLKIKVTDIDYGQQEPPEDAPLQSYVLDQIIPSKAK